jgi:putative endonuclease
MWYIYVLKSLKDGKLYVGMSENPDRRLLDHNSGMTKSIKSRRPFKIIYKEECGDRMVAREREKYMKSGAGRRFIKQLTTPP